MGTRQTPAPPPADDVRESDEKGFIPSPDNPDEGRVQPADSPDAATLPATSDESVPDDRSVSERHDARIAEAREFLGLDSDGNPKPVPAASKMPPPVYDERGNVRPRGTPGTRPMSYADRVKIAQRLAQGETIVTTAELVRSKDADTRARRDADLDAVPAESVVRTSAPSPTRPGD